MNIVPPNPDAIEVDIAGIGEIFLYINPVYNHNIESSPFSIFDSFATCRFKNITCVEGKYYPASHSDKLEYYNWNETDSQGFVLFSEDPTEWYPYNKRYYPLAYNTIVEWMASFRLIVMEDHALPDAFLITFWRFYADFVDFGKKPKLCYDFLPGLWFEEWGEIKHQFQRDTIQCWLEERAEERELRKTDKYSTNKKGIVYFVQNTETLTVKIGWTTEERLKARMSALQIGNCQELKLLKIIKANDAFQKEQEFHQIFSDYHIRGEWFRCEGKLKTFLK